jgi:regulator of protease activity HflC (stomatin/prohibitin superfamily)
VVREKMGLQAGREIRQNLESTMGYSKNNIAVSFKDRTVDIDGVIHKCLPPSGMEGTYRTLRWTPGGDPPGFMVKADETGGGFEDFNIIAVFAAYWEVGQKARAALDEKAKAVRDKEVKAEQAEEEKRKAEQADWQRRAEAQQPLLSAMGGLASSDHEVIKAMERVLAEAGQLPPDMVQKRQDWRATVKAERKKLEGK